MEAEHEELSANPFWIALLKRSEMLTEIAQDKALVCVPSSESVKLCKLTPDFLATHILIPVTDEVDLYSTRNGKTVQFAGGRVVCQTGFPRPRTVMVIYEETFYDDDFNAIRCLRTNFPLEGKIPLAYYKSVANQAAVDLSALNARTLPEHQMVLCKMAMTPAAAAALPTFSPEQALANIGVSPSPALVPHPALPPVFASLSRFIVSFNLSYVMVKGFVDHAGSKVKDACEKIKEELMHSLPGGSSSSSSGVAKMSRLTSMEASAAIEACVFTGVHQKLYHGLVELYKAEEARTQAILASCDAVSMADLGVRAELVCEPTLAVAHLAQALNGMFAVTPLQKLGVLDETNRLLTQTVDAKLAEARAHADWNADEKQDTTLAADDMLPLWIWLVLQAKPLHIHANLVFMQHFQPATSLLNVQQLKVHLANLQGAVQFVDSGKLGSGGAMLADLPAMMPEHPPRRVRAASTIVTNSFANLSVRDAPHSSANPFGRANSSTAAAASAASSSSASPAGFTRRSSVHRADNAAQLLDSIEDGLNELQESQRGRPSALAVASPAGGHQHALSTSHMRQSSMTQLHSSSSMTPQPRSELPSTRLSRHGSLSHAHSSTSAAQSSASASPAVAAAAASSVHRMGDFLAGLHRQDDGATGRLGYQPAEPQRQQPHSQPNSRRATGPSGGRGFVSAGPSVLELDDADLPPLIVTRTAPQRRY